MICEGTPVALTVTGTPANTYKWYLNTTTLAGTTSSPTFNANQPGTYTVVLDNGSVNNGTGSVTLDFTKKPIVDFTYESSCLGKPTIFTDASNVSGSLPVDYAWNFGGSVTPSNQPSPTITYPNSGTYNVQFTITPQACPSLATTSTKTVIVKGPTPNVRYPDKAALENVPLQLQARSIGASYSWSPGTDLNNANIMMPIFKGTTEMDYVITITDNLGCTTIDSQLVKVFKEVNIYMPKAFSPNADGRNDLITPITVGIKQIKLFRIINRWGVIVYEAKSTTPGWDGRYKGAPQPMDGYVWEIQAVDYFGKNHSRQGSFTLIR
jgi:gliding motility-associated-like protein